MTTTDQLAQPRIGFLGPGAMGAGMVSRMQTQGHHINIYARNAAKVTDLLTGGATFFQQPVDLVASSDIVLGCLLDTNVIREIYLGTAGIAYSARPGQIFVEHATFDPSLAQEIATVLQERGAQFIDAPVSGGPAGAANGTLVAMIGADATVITTIAPVLGMYCANLKHAGGVGAGLRLKLINQLLVSVHAVAAAEAAALVQANGIDPLVAHEALMGGWAASTMLDLQLPKACAQDFESGGAAIGGLIEVQKLVSDFCAQSDIHSNLLGPVKQVFANAVEHGHGDSGLPALVSQYPSTTK